MFLIRLQIYGLFFHYVHAHIHQQEHTQRRRYIQLIVQYFLLPR